MLALTAIDVIDTAIKIGLGAAIGAVSSYVIAVRSHKNELERDYIKRRQDVIRDVSARVAAIHSDLTQICATYHGLIDYIATGQPLAQDAAEEAIAQLKTVGSALKELYVLAGELLLVGATEASATLDRYHDQVGAFNAVLSFQPPMKSKEEVLATGQELSRRRTDFYVKLAAAFKNI